MSADGAGDAFSFDAVDVGKFGDDSVAVNARIKVCCSGCFVGGRRTQHAPTQLSEALVVETRVPLPSAPIAVSRVGGVELARADFRISVTNNVVTLALTVRVTSPMSAGQLLSDVVDADSSALIEVAVSGVPNAGNVISTVLSHMNFRYAIVEPDQPKLPNVMMAKDLFTIQSLTLVSGANSRAHFALPLALESNIVNIDLPSVVAPALVCV